MSLGSRLCGILRGLIALILFVPTCPKAAEVFPGPITATVIDVIDGDTLRIRARIWLDQEVTVILRLAGIDTPELRSHCLVEKQFAEKAKSIIAFLTMGVDGKGQTVTLTNLRHDKYGGRVLGEVRLSDGRDLATILVTANLARSYTGGPRQGWCG